MFIIKFTAGLVLLVVIALVILHLLKPFHTAIEQDENDRDR